VIISNTEKYKTQASRAFFMKMIAFDERETTVDRSTYW
jgi:hypothetical protein